MLVDAQLQGAGVEDFIVVGVKQERPHARAPVVPGVDSFEGIVEGDGDVAVL